MNPISHELRSADTKPSVADRRPRALVTADADTTDYVAYEIDGNGTLVWVSPNWDEFALANGQPGLRARQCLGSRFEGLLGDRDTVEAQRRITARCASRNQRATFLFRSDAPFVRKLMMMWVDPLSDAGFRFTVRVLDSNSLGKRIYTRLLQIAQQPVVARCGTCRRYRWLGTWMEVDDHLVDQATMKPRAVFRHTLCPQCRDTQRGLPRLVV